MDKKKRPARKKKKQQLCNIYLIYCIVNKKVWVGQENKEGYRWKKHIEAAFKYNSQYPLHRAMRKRGLKNFIRITLSFHQKSQINNFERFFVKLYNANNPRFGYNLTEGGDGCPNPSKSTRRKMSRAHKGRKKSKEEIEKLRKSCKKWWTKEKKRKESQRMKRWWADKKNHKKMIAAIKAGYAAMDLEVKKELYNQVANSNTGKKRTKKSRRKIAKANREAWKRKGKNYWSEEGSKRRAEKISKALKGRKFSEEHCRHISESHKKYWANKRKSK